MPAGRQRKELLPGQPRLGQEAPKSTGPGRCLGHKNPGSPRQESPNRPKGDSSSSPVQQPSLEEGNKKHIFMPRTDSHSRVEAFSFFFFSIISFDCVWEGHEARVPRIPESGPALSLTLKEYKAGKWPSRAEETP